MGLPFIGDVLKKHRVIKKGHVSCVFSVDHRDVIN